MSSLFSRIIEHEVPASFVFEEERWVAFMDIQPIRPGHVLLVPRHEARFLHELPGGTLAELGAYLRALNLCLKRVCAQRDTVIILRDGPAAGQVVPHVHWHLVPRQPDEDGRDFEGGCYHPDADTDARMRQEMADALSAAWRGR